MKDINKEAFKLEFQDLLEKYNVSISTGGYGDYFQIAEVGADEAFLTTEDCLYLTAETLKNSTIQQEKSQ